MPDRYAIIPARGGSRRIYRKNLAVVGERTLLGQAIDAAIESGWAPIVSTDSPEIAAHARACGAQVHDRPPALAGGSTPVTTACAAAIVDLGLPDDSWCMILQPTVVPALLVAREAARYANQFQRDQVTLRCVFVLCSEDTSLRYAPGAGFLQIHKDRYAGEVVSLPETGAYLLQSNAARMLIAGDDPPFVSARLADLPSHSILDVDWPHEIHAARHLAQRQQRIATVTLHGRGYGIGHQRRTEALAAELQEHAVILHTISEPGAWPDGLGSGYDVVVIDALDTTARQIAHARDAARRVVVLEDRGAGARSADVVINELYARPLFLLDPAAQDRHYCGARFAVIPTEMRALPPKPVPERGTRVVVTLGGQDPEHLTGPIIEALLDAGVEDIVGIVGPEAVSPARIATFGNDPSYAGRVRWCGGRYDPPVMLDELRNADVAVTSAGRTVHECLAVGTFPVIVPVNERERLHQFPDWLGDWKTEWEPAEIAEAARALCFPAMLDHRLRAATEGPKAVRDGTRRVVDLILERW